jgi:hypothetical protein
LESTIAALGFITTPPHELPWFPPLPSPEREPDQHDDSNDGDGASEQSSHIHGNSNDSNECGSDTGMSDGDSQQRQRLDNYCQQRIANYCPRRRRQICGVDLFRFVLYLQVEPEATDEEIEHFIFRKGGEMYSDEAYVKRRKEYQKEEDKVLPLANIRTVRPPNTHGFDWRCKIWAYWNCTRTGVLGIPRKKFIDIVEFGVTLGKCKRSNKWIPKLHRVGTNGHCFHENKSGDRIGLSAILAIEAGDPAIPPEHSGSTTNPRRWIRCIRSNVIYDWNLYQFCGDLCSDIEQYHDEHGLESLDTRESDHMYRFYHRIFTWESTRTNDSTILTVVIDRVRSVKFSKIERPPGHPHFSPAEYKMCEVAERLRLVEGMYDWDLDTLEEVLCGICYHRLRNFDSVFEHCGYRK